MGALGVVFGDIGTSPLYALHECLAPRRGVAPTSGDVFGILSLVFWSLTAVVAIKYLVFVLCADNNGEGGIFALLALLPERLRTTRVGGTRWTTALVLIGAGLLFGDGIITPAISVLSAMEGLQVAAPQYHHAVVPATCLVLVGLFSLQRRGSGAVGRLFGPVMLIWFVTLAVLGLRQIIDRPGILAAVNPGYAARFFIVHRGRGVLVLGSVVLAITGVEALYADLGHFGRAPIRIGWFVVVMPALILGYFGQGALMLADPGAGAPFFALVPPGAWTYALVGLATVATIIASQALISGVFSLAHQAIQLGFFPIVTVTHTSSQTEGQAYVPAINWALAVACVALVLIFRRSSHLAAAYGLAVTGTMIVTSVIFFEVARTRWRWPLGKAVALLIFFMCFDVPFFGASLFKFTDGGFVPVVIGAALFAIMFTWKRGWTLYREGIARSAPPLERFVVERAGSGLARTPGVGIFVSGAIDGTRPVLSAFVDRIRALPGCVVILTMSTSRSPHAMEIKVESLTGGLYRMSVCTGFMDHPNVRAALAIAIDRYALPIDLAGVTYYLGHHSFLATSSGRMGKRSEWLFSLLARNARPATEHFGIPPHQVVELGSLIDL